LCGIGDFPDSEASLCNGVLGGRLVKLTTKQKAALEYLSWKYGNAGVYYTQQNHKFLHLHVAGEHDEAQIWIRQISKDCRAAFDRIMDNDYSELTKKQRESIEGQEHWRKVVGEDE
jgi:hypothetical protein